MRQKLGKCTELTKNLGSNSMHYYVPGCAEYPLNKALTKLIAVWLVYISVDKSKRWYRSVRAAEIEKIGDVGAVYCARIEWDPTMLNRTDTTYCMKMQSCPLVPCIEAKPRGI
jgi:hypothetical protein